ncbi:hypothetical protein CYLTODRAFT_460586 [Cylindrobasidium torrendii FP15055 ss-10]|uniref:WD40 repeat-like protein n=1 Tax=Cylindrobasidium torrendii FP15055 ss-10 TaxID=1314674 RepID=A0A0D7AQK6_9AGAR|nr:hypothetical protein CYLTODRAFT_460586 [Cylindrobasidium torrendii FP15055 ss-10]
MNRRLHLSQSLPGVKESPDTCMEGSTRRRLSTPRSEKGQYELTQQLDGVTGPIACIAVHPAGLYVACGGMNGTSAWSLSDATQLVSPMIEENRGPTLAMAWLNKPDDPIEGLA